MIRDDWSGLVGAPRWWHLEGGLVILGELLEAKQHRGRTLLHIKLLSEYRLLAIRASGVLKLTIPEPSEYEPS